MVCIILLAGMTGCGGRYAADMQTSDEEAAGIQTSDKEAAGIQASDSQSPLSEAEQEVFLPDMSPDEEKLTGIYMACCENAADKDKTDDLEVMKEIVDRFGAEGYPAVDSENQVNMTEVEQVIRFCRTVEERKAAELAIVEVNYPDGFYVYNLRTEGGEVNVIKSCYEYEDSNMKKTTEISYLAEYWEYTADGYLIFSGRWFSEEMYVLVLGGAEEHTALRVLPLNEICREGNRKYILPVGYGMNNIFFTDWSEEDFGKLNFYDVFDKCYPLVCKQAVPYTADDSGIGAVYRIPEEIFESIIMRYFHVDCETLQAKTVYLPKDRSYEYRPRGFYERDYPEMPYPEVESYTENADGTITLIVHAVYPKENTSRAFEHKTVIRPLENGTFQYVSNQMIFSGEKYDAWWHTERASEEEWEAMYGDEKKTEEWAG